VLLPRSLKTQNMPESGLAAAQVSAADADHGDRDHRHEQGDRGGDQEGAVEAGRQRVLVSRLPRGSAGGGPGASAVREHRPGHGTQHREAEREVVALVAHGLSNDEIAEALIVSSATAKTHVSRAMIKLGWASMPGTGLLDVACGSGGPIGGHPRFRGSRNCAKRFRGNYAGI